MEEEEKQRVPCVWTNTGTPSRSKLGKKEEKRGKGGRLIEALKKLESADEDSKFPWVPFTGAAR